MMKLPLFDRNELIGMLVFDEYLPENSMIGRTGYLLVDIDGKKVKILWVADLDFCMTIPEAMTKFITGIRENKNILFERSKGNE